MAFSKNIYHIPKSTNTIWLHLILVIICLNIIGTHKLNAQTNPAVTVATIIKGSITDENGMPVPGVKIINNSTKITAVTNMDGNFEIASLINDTIEVNFHDIVVQYIQVLSLNKLNVLLTTAQVDQQKTLTSYPVNSKVASVSKPLKFSLPDADFFSSALRFVTNKVK